jgi:hypothetical protein
MECALDHVGSNSSAPGGAPSQVAVRSNSMPFPLIPTALGLCFFLMWVFIGGMIFRDGQIATRCDREHDGDILPLAPSPLAGSAARTAPSPRKMRRNTVARAAS